MREVETVKIEVPLELADDVRRYVERLKRRKKLIKETFGILKTEKSATELKVEIYEELYG
ncbi:hypothetical protein [Thermococcus siculi]|uniref:hypothetical protein n=1 Tax=Thermococcus siculi TaxID=72803 RepID=UPI0012FE3F27|nr:hypothetical protein [Thermococcus siculi]